MTLAAVEADFCKFLNVELIFSNTIKIEVFPIFFSIFPILKSFLDEFKPSANEILRYIVIFSTVLLYIVKSYGYAWVLSNHGAAALPCYCKFASDTERCKKAFGTDCPRMLGEW